MDIPIRLLQLRPFRRIIHWSVTVKQIRTTAWRRDQSIHFMVTKNPYHVWQYSLSWTWLYRAARWVLFFRRNFLAEQFCTVNSFTFFLQDGTVNVHTIKDGQFIRTLKPMNCTGDFIQITYITLSYQGMHQTISRPHNNAKILNFNSDSGLGYIAFSALDDTSHSVHVFSINGTHLGSKYVSGRVTGLTTANDNLIVADDAGDITMSRLYG